MEVLPKFTISRAFEIFKEAAMFSGGMPEGSRINSFAVLYEAKDMEKANFGMKHTDYLSGRMWTNGSVSMNEIVTPFPFLAVIEFPNRFSQMFENSSYTVYDLWIIVADVIKEGEVDTSDSLSARNLIKIFQDTEEALRFVKYYFSNVEPFHVVKSSGNVNGWFNKQHLEYLQTQGEIISFHDCNEYSEFVEEKEWYDSFLKKFNESNNFDRYAFAGKDNLAASRLNIQFPVFDCKEYEPAFYVDTKVIKYE